MLLPILLLSTAATLPLNTPLQRDKIAIQRSQDLPTNTCYKIRAYIFSQEPNPQLKRMVTCVPADRTATKRASGARYVPLGKSPQSK